MGLLMRHLSKDERELLELALQIAINQIAGHAALASLCGMLGERSPDTGDKILSQLAQLSSKVTSHDVALCPRQ